MLNIGSILIAMAALFFAAFGFAPFVPGGYWLAVVPAIAGIPVQDVPPLLGWMAWLLLPLALIGLAIGQLSDRRLGRNLNLIFVALGIMRLFLLS